MELKRDYRTVRLKNNDNTSGLREKVIKNNPLRRHFSLTDLYYNFSNYGESIAKPTIIGAITVGLSTLFWLIQNNPTAEPSLSVISKHSSQHMSNFINMTYLSVWNNTHVLKAFERSFSDFFSAPVIVCVIVAIAVMYSLSSLAKNAITFATSSGLPVCQIVTQNGDVNSSSIG